MKKETLIIKSPEQLLAQVYAMKCESEDRLQDLVDSLRQHNNFAAADIFSRTIHLIQLYLKNIEQRSQGMNLPEIPPWESQWHCDSQPDLSCIENAHYLMTPIQAVELAILNENRLQEFFKQQANNEINNDVRRISNELGSLEKEYAKQMHSWKQSLNNIETEQIDDLDPPNIPE